MRRVLVTVMLVVMAVSQVIAAGQAQEPSLETLLAAVRDNAALQANAALLEAAEARLNAAYSPVALNGSAGAGFISYEGLDGRDPGDLNLPERTTQIDVGLSFRPFLYGDLADLASQQAVELARAQLGLAETLASLEVQVVEAAIGLTLAQESLALAQEGAELSDELLNVTQTRFERGGATDSELRSAAQQAAEAEANVLSSEANVSVAREGLALLVGADLAVALDRVPQLKPIGGISPDVLRARFDVVLAELGLAGSDRAFLPTAQVGYAVPFEDEKSELSFSIESATLQPSVDFSYQDPKQSLGGQQIPDDVGGGEGANVRPTGTLSLGLSLDLSFADFDNRKAARAQLEAAEAGLRGALEREPLTALNLSTALEANRVRLELAKSALANAERDVAETQRRLDAGLATELDVAQSEFALTQVGLEHMNAERDLAVSILDSYRTYAVPISSLLSPTPTTPTPEAQP